MQANHFSPQSSTKPTKKSTKSGLIKYINSKIQVDQEWWWNMLLIYKSWVYKKLTSFLSGKFKICILATSTPTIILNKKTISGFSIICDSGQIFFALLAVNWHFRQTRLLLFCWYYLKHFVIINLDKEIMILYCVFSLSKSSISAFFSDIKYCIGKMM